MPDVQRIEPEDILPESSGKVELSPLQRVGVYGAVTVGCVGGAALVFLLGHWVWVAPHQPMIPVGADESTAKLLLANYNSLREAAQDDTLKLLDAFVTKLLLPIFTSFVGYIFGSQAAKET